jgi:ABC-type Mn2+/Zn2+ transport system ATPase subunit
VITRIEDLVFNDAKGFIVLEGPNGAGKSTVAAALKKLAG